MPPDLQSQLERFLAGRLPDADGVRVLALERNMEGFSQECFSFDAEIRRGERRELRSYVLKREPLTGLLEPYDLEPEFKVLHALSDQALLSPPTPWFSDDPALLERPFYVMEKLPGEVPLPVEGPDGDGPFSEGQRRALAPQVAQALAKLHAVGWREHGLGFLGAPEPGRAAAERELARWEERIERAGFPMAPVLAESLAWLRANVPATDEITLVHGDYRLGNFLVELEPDDAQAHGHPRLGDGAPGRPPRGSGLVQLAAVARRNAQRGHDAVAGGVRGRLCGRLEARDRSRPHGLLRDPLRGQDERHHAHGHPRLPGRAHGRAAHGRLRPSAALPPRAPRGVARMALGGLTMYITLERLIDGCIHTLRDDVMPEVGTRVARGQVWAVIDILQNMRNRIEEKAELSEAESASAEQALAQLVAALRDAGAGSDAAALERACADAPAGPPAERTLALRAALVQAVDALYALPSRDALPEAARAALGAHLGPQAVRNVLPLTRSKLNEISKG